MLKFMLFTALIYILISLFVAYSAFGEGPLKTLILEEDFGVSHPNQIVDFDLDIVVDPKNSYLIGPDGEEIPYQLLEGGKKLAVRTNLPAYSKLEWKLMSGKAPEPYKYAVMVTKNDEYYEISNLIVGIRIPIPPKKLDYVPAPVQAVRYNDGTWTGEAPNYLSVHADETKEMTVDFIEQGPLKVIVQVGYKFQRPEYKYGDKVYKEAGDGYYRSTIEIQAGQSSILFEEDTDMELSYSLNVYKGLYPDQARYRGHHSTAKEYGYESDGRQYRQWHERSNMDAFVDLTYQKPITSSYLSSSDTWRRMAVWDPWVYNSGWYWQMYSSTSGREDNLFGIFAGKASRAIGAANSGVGIFTEPLDDNAKAAGITVSASLRSPDARTFPRIRFSWGMFMGIIVEDLKTPEEVQTIAQQMNLHSGFNLNKVHRYKLNYPDPPQGYGGLYMENETLHRIIQKVRIDKEYYSYLYNAEPSSRDLIDLWADPTGEKAKKAFDAIMESGRNVLERLVNGDGIYDFSIHYWHGGLEMMRKGLWIDQVLASGQLSPEEEKKVKAVAVLFAKILWDDDFVPLFTEHGLNLGNPNMPVQQTGYRRFYALFLSEHPDMKKRAEAVTEETMKTVREIINEHGAEMGCVHYIGASFAPTLNTLLQIKMLGKVDPFATEPRLSKFAEFYMNFLAPTEPRFDGKRKYISIGDSSTESSEMYGQLATGFRDSDPELSSRLMGAWIAGGKKHSGFFGTTIMMIDEEAPAKNPMLGNGTFPGWYSVLRNGWGTENETALWMVNGDFYSDHRHNDHGSVVIYALGGPLSVDWGSIYYPHVPGGFMHNIVLPEEKIGHPWDKDDPPLNAGHNIWGNSKQDESLSFKTCAYATGDFQNGSQLFWRRTITSIHPNPNYPIIIIRDDFDGEDAATSKISTLNLMANGDVQTQAGVVSPILRTYKNNNELPSAGKVFNLSPGLNEFGFTGQFLIDWELYTVSDENQQFQIGNWADNWHQEVQNFEERQHILRIKGNSPFTTIILPYRKGEKPKRKVTMEGDSIGIENDNEDILIHRFIPYFYSYQSPHVQILANMDTENAAYNDVSIEGGQAEVAIKKNEAVITMHGYPGLRKIRIPGIWKARNSGDLALTFSQDYTIINLDYPEGNPITFFLER